MGVKQVLMKRVRFTHYCHYLGVRDFCPQSCHLNWIILNGTGFPTEGFDPMSLLHVCAETDSGFETLWTPAAQGSYIEMTFTMGYGRGLVGHDFVADKAFETFLVKAVREGFKQSFESLGL